MSEQDKSAPVEQTICLNPIHNETICSQNQDFYTHKQEPVAWMSDCDVGFKKSEFGTYPCVPLYTHPKEWVGLTDEEMKAALVSVDANTQRFPPGFKAFARAIEAKLKEKNNG